MTRKDASYEGAGLAIVEREDSATMLQVMSRGKLITQDRDECESDSYYAKQGESLLTFTQPLCSTLRRSSPPSAQAVCDS